MNTLVLEIAAGCTVVGGVFLAFSTVVLPALFRLPGAEAERAMRSINVLAVRPPFMVALFGTAATCAALGAPAVRHSDPWVVLGCGSYLLGVVVVTVAANVPLNERLARGEVAFDAFAGAWVRWNHVRTAAALVAAASLIAHRGAAPPS